jgi:hypothetical protein
MKYVYFLNNKALMDLNIRVGYMDIIIFEFIHSFSKYERCETKELNGETYYWVSHTQIQKNIISDIESTSGIIKRINHLVTAGLIKKHPDCRRLRRSYYAFTPLAKQYFQISTFKTDDDSGQNGQRSLDETDRDHWTKRTEDYNTNDSNDEVMKKEIKQTTLFEDNEIENKELRFEDSPANNIEYVRKKLKDAVDAGINVDFYFESVADWAATIPKRSSKGKRTTRGWIATIRTFIRAAKTSGKLEMLKNNEIDANNNKTGILDDEIRLREILED